jgi:hypothetical protein
VAVANLEDRLAWLATKSTIQAFLKRELTKNLQAEHGLTGRIAGDLFSLFTQQADLRAWQTLPDTWQACRIFLPPGQHELQIKAPGYGRWDLGHFELAPGETMFVIARAVGGEVYAHPVGGLRVDRDGQPRP